MLANNINKFGVPLPTGGGLVMSQPKPRNKFRVVTYGFGADSSWGNHGAWMCMQTNSCSRPKLSVQTHEMHRFDSIARYSGKIKWNEIQLRIKDTVDNKPATAIHSHIQKQKDFYKRIAPRMNGYGYKFEMMIQTMKGDFSDDDSLMVVGELLDKYVLNSSDPSISPKLLAGTFETWLCTGCIVTDYDFGEYDYSTSNFNEIVLTIQPDNCVLVDQAGNLMLESSQSAGFDMGGFLGGLFSAGNKALGEALGLSGPVTEVAEHAVKDGLNSAYSSIKGFF